MKKLLIKSEFTLIPFSPFIPGVPGAEPQPEKWTKGEEVVFELPQDLTEWTHHPGVEAVEAIPEVPEVAEVKEWRVIDQTQGPEEELHVWLAGNIFKYPEGFVTEWIDLTAQFEQEKINSEALGYLASTDWLVIREVDAAIPCPEDIKLLRAEARSKIVR